MAKLGTLWFDTKLTNDAVKDAEKIKKQISSALKQKIVVNATVDKNALRESITNALSNFKPKVKVGVSVDRESLSKIERGANGLLQQANAHNTAKKAAEGHWYSMIKLNSSIAQGISLSGRLSQTLALVFSLNMLKNFALELVNIGGEFQKQRIALENMLKSKAKADALYSRMKELAVESPFTFKDLMSYTKQLEAFQIPYNELYDTTKRLADLSAGLGVDMSRIILAYGQVRSAAFLRGQEVRQFTEAGIPLLDALSKKFTELEGKVVSVGDVFERISKRQVSFDMVKDVLWELTDESGQFYNMQAKLTESLTGKLAKLRDTYEITVGEIAQGNNKALGGFLDALTGVVKNLEVTIKLLCTAGASFAIFKAATALLAVNLGAMRFAFLRNVVAIRVYIRALYQAAIGVKALDAATKRTTWGLVAAAIVAVGGTLWALSSSAKSSADKIRELSSEFEKANQVMEENDQIAKRLVKNMFDESRAIEEKRAAYIRLQEIYPDMFKNMSFEEAHHKGMLNILQLEAKASRDTAKAKAKAYLTDVKTEKAAAQRIFERDYSDEAIYKKLWHQDPRFVFSSEKRRKERVEEYKITNEGYKEAAKAYAEAIEAERNALEILDKINDDEKKLNEAQGQRWYDTAKNIINKKGKDLYAGLMPTSGDREKYEEEIIKVYDELDKKIKSYDPTTVGGKEVLPDLLERLEVVKQIGKEALGLDLEKKTTGAGGGKKDQFLEDWKARISLLDKYRKELEDLSKFMTREEAESKLKSEGNFASLFDVFKNPNDYIGSIKEAIKQLGTVGERGKYAKSLGAKIGDEALRNFTKDTEDAVEELQKMLDVLQENYNTYKKWVELTGDESLAAKIAGVKENTSYYDLLRYSFNKLGGAKGLSADEFFGLSEVEAKSFGEKSGLFALWKEWQDNEKKIKAENLKLYEDAIKNAKSYADQIEDINRQLEREKKAINETAKSQAEANKLTENAEKNANKKKADILWNQFKDANDWGRIFSDLNNISSQTLRGMLDKLRDIAPTISESVEATKALYEAMDKIDDMLNQRNPFKAMAESVSTMTKIGKLDRYISKKFPGIGNDELIGLDAKTAKRYGLGDGKKGWQGTRNDLYDAMWKASNDFEKAIGGVGKAFSSLQDTMQPVIDLMSALGHEEAGDIFSAIGGSIGSASKVMGGINSLSGMFEGNKGMQKALKKIGPYAAVAGAAISLITFALQEYDKSLQKQIEESQTRLKEVERVSSLIEKELERSYSGVYGYSASKNVTDVLNKALDNFKSKAFTVDIFKGTGYSKETKAAAKEALASKSYYDSSYATLLMQRDEIQRQAALEASKKKSDMDKLSDYKEQFDELSDKIKNFAIDMANALYGIDIKSWAEELGDAIVSAWDEGTDAAVAFHDKVQDLMKDVTKNILVQKVIGAAFESMNIDKIITELMSKKNGNLNENDVEALFNAIVSATDTSSEIITAVLDKLEAKGVIRRGDGSESNSLSGNIKGITEDTADLLASYLNAIRADVSVDRANLSIYLPSFNELLTRSNVIAESQVQLQTQIAENTLRNANAAEEIMGVMRRIELGETRISVK